MLMFVIQHQPHRAGTDLRRELVACLLAHGSTFSRVGASGEPGAVHFSLYIGFIIIVASAYSSMKFPGPKVIWREIQLKWYVHKLEQLSNRVAHADKSIDADDQRLIEKIQTMLNKEEARLHKVSKMLADLQARMS